MKIMFQKGVYSDIVSAIKDAVSVTTFSLQYSYSSRSRAD